MKLMAFSLFMVLAAVPPCGLGAGLTLANQPNLTVLHSPRATANEILAAKEVRRYVYLRTGQLLPIRAAAEPRAGRGDAIVVARKDDPLARQLATDDGLARSLDSLEPSQFWLRTFKSDGRAVLLLTGGDDVGTLYAAYRFAEILGVRFYLHGDVVPDQKRALKLEPLDERQMPLFGLRGIQPFHDFPEGPDWWNLDDYAAVIAQSPKLRLNFLALHTYPEGAPNAEPTVWIGLGADADAQGRVSYSYPASYMNTLRGNWGYQAKRTVDFIFGGDQLFEREAFAADVMLGCCPEPRSGADCNAVFDQTGEMLRRAFTLARRLGVKTCVGTETPLTIPQWVQRRLKTVGKDPNDPAVRREVYAGLFQRAARAYPLDYYWFWTPEGWTWEGTKEEQVKRTIDDLQTALAAAQDVQAPFRLATCGWVLGPQQDRALFDKVLPKEVAVSCISREVGRTPVDRGFAEVSGRGKWAIPWLEDDPALTIPQLWVGRMRRDAAAARRYGCDGLMGIHWRTRVLGPNVAALAQAAWSQEAWNKDPLTSPAPSSAEAFAPVADFYLDWARHEFGEEVGPLAAALFAKVDGRLPRPADWVDGPGGIRPDARPWAEVEPQYAFVADFEALADQVRGTGHRARFDYWVETFRYLRAMAQLNCTWAAYNQAVEKAKAAELPSLKQLLLEMQALPLRRQMVRELRAVYGHLLATVSNPGEMGTVANWDQHLLPGLLTKPAEELARLLGGPLPPDALPDQVYRGPTRVFLPTTRGSLVAGETLRVKVIVLAASLPKAGWLRWRRLGSGGYQAVALRHAARGVHFAELPAKASETDFEYYVEIEDATGARWRAPATAPALNQTVVIMPRQG